MSNKEEGNESGSDDDIAFADDDNDTNAQEEETNVESYDSEDEDLQKEVRTTGVEDDFCFFLFFFSLFLVLK
jgi:hypothetical protein